MEKTSSIQYNFFLYKLSFKFLRVYTEIHPVFLELKSFRNSILFEIMKEFLSIKDYIKMYYLKNYKMHITGSSI